ncbi:hypothetical protein ACJX0J_032537, partial [Zea mays]
SMLSTELYKKNSKVQTIQGQNNIALWKGIIYGYKKILWQGWSKATWTIAETSQKD